VPPLSSIAKDSASVLSKFGAEASERYPSHFNIEKRTERLVLGRLRQLLTQFGMHTGCARATISAEVDVENEPELRLFSCALAPGSTHVSSRVALHAIPPEGQAPGVDRIVLRAGGHEADLSAALHQVDAIVTELEEHLEAQLVGKERSPALVDLFIVAAHSR